METTEITTNIASETVNTNTTVIASPTAAPAPVSELVVRRVYVEHRIYGSCITYEAMVFVPADAKLYTAYDKKSTPRIQFRITGKAENAEVIDVANGASWICVGENGGCGPRCPLSLREQFKTTWHGLSRAERIEILKANAPKTAAAAK